MRGSGLMKRIVLIAIPSMTISAYGDALAKDQGVEPHGADRAIVAGPLTIEVSISRTAHLFHVVDQLSAWSPFCHAQYRRHFEDAEGGLSDPDRKMLEEHAALRKLKGWGMGLEQTFYTGLELGAALEEGIERGHLTPEQAAIERVVLNHFAPRIERLMREQAGTLEAFRERLAGGREDLAGFAERVSKFFGGARPNVPVFLISNPSEGSIGGGYNGGRLTIEVPTKSDAYPSFLHEIFHAFIETKRPALEQAVVGVKGLDYQTLNEGLAYAIAPGIIHPGAGPLDPLRDRVAADLAARKPLRDDYARFNRFGLALRPSLEEALHDRPQTVESYLPRAVDVWRALREVSSAWEGPTRRRSTFSFGPGWKVLAERVTAGGVDLFSYNHDRKHYEEAFSKANRGETVFLLLALDHQDRPVPEEYRDLLPRPWPEIEARLKQGMAQELTGQARGQRVILLAAPTERGLEVLIRETELLGR